MKPSIQIVREFFQYQYTISVPRSYRPYRTCILWIDESDFICKWLCGISTHPMLTISALEYCDGLTGETRALISSPVDFRNLFGEANRPSYLLPPVRFPAGSRIKAKLENHSGKTNRVQLDFFGEKELRVAGKRFTQRRKEKGRA